MKWTIEKRAKIYSAIAHLESLGLTVHQIQARLGVSEGVIYKLRNGQGLPNPTPSPYGLTKRELAILKLIAEAKNSRGIAAVLNISLKTVNTHTTNIYEKLDVSNDSFVSKRVAAAIILKELILC